MVAARQQRRYRYRSSDGAVVYGAAPRLDGMAESERVAQAIRHAEAMYPGSAKEKEGG